jgi:hypothetical protein
MVPDEALFRPAAASLAHKVKGPRPAVNSWTVSSTLREPTGEENLTVTDEAPVVLTVPSQSSRSCEALSEKETSLAQAVAPPPVTEVTVAVAEDTFTVRTRASPRFLGLTGTELTPSPCTSVSLPTAEITGADDLRYENWSAVVVVLVPTSVVTANPSSCCATW